MPRGESSMPKLVNYGTGKRVSVSLLERHLKIWNDLENKSEFVQLCLENAVDIMTWDILKKEDPETFHIEQPPIEEVIPHYNDKHPLNKLTAQRLGKETWPKNSVKPQENW
jgi:hypothetical protein